MGDNGEQRSLVGCSPWGHRVGHELATEQVILWMGLCSSGCVCLCVYMYLCICVYLGVCVYTCVSTYLYMSVCVSMSVHSCSHGRSHCLCETEAGFTE